MSVSKGGRRKINKRPELVAAVAFDLAADNSFVPSTTGGPRSIPTGIIATPVVRPTCGNTFSWVYIYIYVQIFNTLYIYIFIWDLGVAYSPMSLLSVWQNNTGFDHY